MTTLPNELSASRELRRIAEDLGRMHRGPAWHGPSVREALEGVAFGTAVARAHPGAHNIYELAHHIAAWIGETTHRLQGGKAGEPKEGDFPSPNDTPDDARWQAILRRIDEAHEALQAAILTFDAERLDDVVGGASESPTTYLTMLHGAISHDAYHAGQIVLLRKSLG